MVKYKENFNRDYNWYLENKNIYTFDGSSLNDKVRYSINGKDAKFCFYTHDSIGKIIETNEPELLTEIYKCKGSINFHIKMWSEGVAERISFISEFMELNLLPWMIKSIRNQADKIGYKDWENKLEIGYKYKK